MIKACLELPRADKLKAGVYGPKIDPPEGELNFKRKYRHRFENIFETGTAGFAPSPTESFSNVWWM